MTKRDCKLAVVGTCNSWSFKYRGREVSIALDDKNQLQVKGLMMRSYNQDLIKKDPEAVEAIYIKKG